MRRELTKNDPDGVIASTPIGERYPELFGPDNRPVPRELIDTTGIDDAGEPMAPLYPEGGPPRTWPIRFGQNMTTTPRLGWSRLLTPFSQLRQLADFDLVRIAIEDVKGQILGMEWVIKVKESFKDDADNLADAVDTVRRFVEEPDPLAGLDYHAWAGRVLEEMLTTDALTIYPRLTVGGPNGPEPIGLEQTDGTTILPLVDRRGRPPLPPAPAYQQVINGMVEREFTMGELWYLPYNRRADAPYGRSPVEQVIVTVNLAIRAHLHEIGFYADGNLPDSLYALPDGWSTAQVGDFQKMWDELLDGRSDRRAGNLRFIPGGQGTQYIDTKQRQLSYEYFEWLARVIAWSFGVSPLPIAKQQNRSTGETLEQSTTESGVKPRANFLKRVVNRYIVRVLHETRVEFAWKDADTEEDAATGVTRRTTFVSGGIESIDEARAAEGRDALGLDEPFIVTTTGGIRFVSDLKADMIRARKKLEAVESGDEDATSQGIDPTRIQRAFLEAGVLRVDELRTALGADPLGADAGGDEFATIAAPGEPVNGPMEPSEEEPEPVSETEELGDGGEPDAPGGEVDVPEAPEEGAAKAVRDPHLRKAGIRMELSRWRRMATKRARLGKRQRAFVSSRLPVIPMMRMMRRLDGVALAESVPEIFKQGEPEFTTAQSQVEQAIFDAINGWLDGVLPEVIALAEAELAAGVEKMQHFERNFPSLTAGAGRAGLGKADIPLDLLDAESLFDALTEALSEAAVLGEDDIGTSLGIAFDGDALADDTLLFSQERAAELVGRKWVEGALVENPNPIWSITGDMRADINAKITAGLEGGWSPQRLGNELTDILGRSRAMTVARTETAFAFNEGTILAMEDAAIENVRILDGSGCLPIGHRDGAPAASGTVGVVEEANEANNQIWPVAEFRIRKVGHPNCVRAAVIHIDKEE